MAVGALLRHAEIGGLRGRIEQCDPLSPDLGDQAGRVREPLQQRAALPLQVTALVIGQIGVVDDGVVQ